MRATQFQSTAGQKDTLGKLIDLHSEPGVPRSDYFSIFLVTMTCIEITQLLPSKASAASAEELASVEEALSEQALKSN